MLVFVYPLGALAMWMGGVWSKTTRIVLTVVFGLWFLNLVRDASKAPDPGSRSTPPSAVAPAAAPVPTPALAAPQRTYIKESCLTLARGFGPGSKLSDLQKEEAWKSFEGKYFEWTLQITEVSSGTFSGYTVQAKCYPESPSLIQDVQISYDSDAKNVVMGLQKGGAYKLRGKLTHTSTLLGLGADAVF